jgi:hypothetical protein
VDKTKCSFAGINRHTHIVERVDRGARIPDDPLAGPRIRPTCVQHSAFLGCSDRRHGGPRNPRSQNSEDITLWDIAGALTIMGCAAAIFSEPDQVVRSFEQLVERHPHTPL